MKWLLFLALFLVVGCADLRKGCPPCEECSKCEECVPPCVPDRNQKICGGDGCGGSCGKCTPTQLCSGGKCAPKMSCPEMLSALDTCLTSNSGTPEDIFTRHSKCLAPLEQSASVSAAYYVGAVAVCLGIESLGVEKLNPTTVNLCEGFAQQCH